MRAALHEGLLDARDVDAIIDTVTQLPDRATLEHRELVETTLAETLDDGSVLPASAARRLACDADVIPMVLNTDSVPLDVGRDHRLVQPKQRQALVARDKGCAFPGCHYSARCAEAHHIREWANGGASDLDNLVLIGKRHLRLVHHSEWSIQVDPAQQLVRNILGC